MLLVRSDDSRAAVIRHDLTAELQSHSVTRESIDDVVLVASELVGNAVMHASAHGFEIGWEIGDDSVVVHVDDSSDGQPVPRRAGATDRNGRGLSIVATLADEWGVVRARHGKQVWARVLISHAAQAARTSLVGRRTLV